MNVDDYLSGLVAKKVQMFRGIDPVNHTHSVLGFTVMESSFYVLPTRPTYLKKVKKVKNKINKKKGCFLTKKAV